MLSLILLCFPSTLALFVAKRDVYFEFYQLDKLPNSEKSLYNEKLGVYHIPAIFSDRKQTFLYIHGYYSQPNTQIDHARFFRDNMPDGESCCNFIVLNWIEGAHNVLYPLVRSRTRLVAETGIEIIESLIARGLKLSELTVVGHSLGAHIAGIIANNFQQKAVAQKAASQTEDNEKKAEKRKRKLSNEFKNLVAEINAKMQYEQIGVVVGVDPAGILYRNIKNLDDEYRLRKGFATYTMIIHTNALVYGLEDPIGDADYFPNGGIFQPCCAQTTKLPKFLALLNQCSHKASSRMYWKTLNPELQFNSVPCETHKTFFTDANRLCIRRKAKVYSPVQMGGNLIKMSDRPKGIFYTETNGTNYETIAPVPVNEFRKVQFIDIASDNDAPIGENAEFVRILKKFEKNFVKPKSDASSESTQNRFNILASKKTVLHAYGEEPSGEYPEADEFLLVDYPYIDAKRTLDPALGAKTATAASANWPTENIQQENAGETMSLDAAIVKTDENQLTADSLEIAKPELADIVEQAINDERVNDGLLLPAHTKPEQTMGHVEQLGAESVRESMLELTENEYAALISKDGLDPSIEEAESDVSNLPGNLSKFNLPTAPATTKNIDESLKSVQKRPSFFGTAGKAKPKPTKTVLKKKTKDKKKIFEKIENVDENDEFHKFKL